MYKISKDHGDSANDSLASVLSCSPLHDRARVGIIKDGGELLHKSLHEDTTCIRQQCKVNVPPTLPKNSKHHP